MKTSMVLRAALGGVLAGLTLLLGCNDKPADPGVKPAATTNVRTTATAPDAPSPPGPPVVARPPADPPGPAKTYDCGAKDQKPCPMQGWMKRVMAPASASGEGEPLAKALKYVAAHPPPGYPDWTTIANAAAAKATAGDIEGPTGAKAACKQCHDAYKDNYKTTMRDRPF